LTENGQKYDFNYNEYWWLTDHEEFALTHYPENLNYLLLDKPLSIDHFWNQQPNVNGIQGVKLLAPIEQYLIPTKNYTFKIFSQKKISILFWHQDNDMIEAEEQENNIWSFSYTIPKKNS
jgi:hypothetical protein